MPAMRYRAGASAITAVSTTTRAGERGKKTTSSTAPACVHGHVCAQAGRGSTRRRGAADAVWYVGVREQTHACMHGRARMRAHAPASL
jgi:hypothetical protein